MMITEIKLHVHLLVESNVNIRVEVAYCDDHRNQTTCPPSC